MGGDELVIDVYESAPDADLFLAEGWITRRAQEQIAELDRLLNEMSGPDQRHLWSAAALTSEPEWDAVRRIARSVLAAT